MRASEIATLVGGQLEGGDDPEITGVAPLERAGPDELSFLAHPRYLAYFQQSGAGVVLVRNGLGDVERDAGVHILVEDVHRALALVLPKLYPEPAPEPGIHPTAVVSEAATIGAGVTIGPYAVVEGGVRLGDRVQVGPHSVVGRGCDVGDDAVLHAHVTLYPGVRIGARTIVHSGARVGVEGFGYVFVDGAHRKIPQVGACVIGADVEIGANATIDRGSIGATEIGDGVKIDNLVHIGHNVRIGEHTVIVAQVGIAGSTIVGRGVTLAGQAGLSGHLMVGDGATVAAQAGVFGDVPAGATYSGYPARPHKEALRAQAATFRLPKLLRRIQAMERKLTGREITDE